MSAPFATESGADESSAPVLVVHADAQFAERVIRALSQQGLRAESVGDGERAIDRFVQTPACALVVDSELPGRDGAATIESIRWAPGGALVPVVLTAGRGGGLKLTETGKRLGAATLEGAAARDPEAVAQLVRRALGRELHAAPARDALTSPAIVVTHTSPTLSALASPALSALAASSATPSRGSASRAALGAVDGAEDGADDDSLPPVSTAARQRGRERETVAARAPVPAFSAPARLARDESASFVRGDDPGAEREGRDVERRAADLTPGAATQAGRFGELPFPRVLARLGAQRATGALVVVAADDDRLRTTTGESPKKVVYFRNGLPVYVKSNLVRECLGQILVGSDTITPAQRNESVQRMRTGEGRQGAILLAMGVIAPHELRDALEEQLRVKLFDLFSWDDAEFRFSSRVLPPPEVVTLELGLAEIVFEGVVRRMAPARLLELLEPQLASYVVPVTDRMTRFVRLDLVVEARLVLRTIDGTQRLRDLLAIAGQRPGAAAQLIFAMECLGALRFSDLPVPTERIADADEPGDETPRIPLPAFRARDAGAETEPVTPALHVGLPGAKPAAQERSGAQWDDETRDESGVELPAWAAAAPPIELATVPAVRAASSTPPSVHVPAADAPISPVAAQPARESTPAESLDVRVERVAEAERHFRRGERALARGKHDDATAAFTRAVQLVPDEGEFLARLAHTQLLQTVDAGLQASALSDLERATTLAPKHYLTHLLLADARRITGDVRGARDAYEDALAADPDCREALDRLRAL